MRLKRFCYALFMAVSLSSVVCAQTAPDDDARHWEFGVAPKWFHKKASGTIDSDAYIKSSGNMWGFEAELASVQERNWYGSLKGSFSSAKLDGSFRLLTATGSEKIRNREWDVMLRGGYHFDMDQSLLDAGIIPFVGLGYQKYKVSIPDSVTQTFAIPGLDIRSWVIQVGVMAQYVIDMNWSVGFEGAVGSTFSAKAKDSNSSLNEKLKNRAQWSVAVPLGYALREQKMWKVEGVRLVPFYESKDFGRDKLGAAQQVFPKLKNRNYGLKLEFYAYF